MGVEAINRGDFEAAVAGYAPNCVWRGTMGVTEGRGAIRTLFEDWFGPYEDFRVEIEALHDLGNGVTFGVLLHRGRPKGTSGELLRVRHAAVGLWQDALIERYTLYDNIDGARAAAERLAKERGKLVEQTSIRDPVERTREVWNEGSRGEFALDMDYYSPHAVLDTAGYGMGTYEGREAIRGFLTEWVASFDDLTMEADEIVGLANGVVLTVYHQTGRPIGGANYVRVRSAMVALWVGGMIERNTIYTESEIDGARAAAERLAEERRSAMSEANVERVRRAYEGLNAGDPDAFLAMYDANIELYVPAWTSLDGGVYRGAAAVNRWYGHNFAQWTDARYDLLEVLDRDPHVLVVGKASLRGKRSGIPFKARFVQVFTFREGRLVAIAQLGGFGGLAEENA
jgi:ketosteroid isomerase-like protein